MVVKEDHGGLGFELLESMDNTHTSTSRQALYSFDNNNTKD